MATFNKDDLIINMVLSGTMFDKASGDVIFSLTMIEEPSLELGGEKVYATDNYGLNIAAFNRSKTAKFSGSNSLFSLGLMANQLGSAKQTGSDIEIPMRELIQVASDKSVTLKKAPVEGSVAIEVLDSGKSITGVSLEQSASSSGDFSISGNKITFSSDKVSAGNYVGVYYKYVGNAVKIVNSADAFTTAGEFRLEVLFAEKCNQAIQYYGYIVFPSAALDNNATINLTTDGKHAFSIEAMTDYCSADHDLFYIVVPDQIA